jgi:hypothetical protein
MSDDNVSVRTTGNYTSPKAQSALLVEVKLDMPSAMTELFIHRMVAEINGYAIHGIEPVDYDEINSVFMEAIFSKLAFVTNTPPRMQITSNDSNVVARRLDDRWVIPSGMIPVLGAIGMITEPHLVTYKPVLDSAIIDIVAEYRNQDPNPFESSQAKLLQLERNGLLVNSAIPRTRDGNVDVLSSIFWSNELYLRRQGVEGVVAALASVLNPVQDSWEELDESSKQVVMSSSIGRDTYKSTYLQGDIVHIISEYVRVTTQSS